MSAIEEGVDNPCKFETALVHPVQHLFDQVHVFVHGLEAHHAGIAFERMERAQCVMEDIPVAAALFQRQQSVFKDVQMAFGVVEKISYEV
jgi:hypothetical protein